MELFASLITPTLRREQGGEALRLKTRTQYWVTPPAGTYVNIDGVAALVLAVGGSPLMVIECVIVVHSEVWGEKDTGLSLSTTELWAEQDPHVDPQLAAY